MVNHIFSLDLGIRSAKEVPKARLITIVWIVFSLWLAIFVGVAGIPHFTNSLSDPEKVFIYLVQDLFNPWVGGILLAAVLAAIMSMIDSQLLVSSSALAEDFYKALFRKNASHKELMFEKVQNS